MDAEFAEFDEPVETIINETTRKAREVLKDKIIKEQLERNIEILKALEEEYLKEEAARDKLNSEFEEEGIESPEEKLEYLKRKAMEEAGLDPDAQVVFDFDPNDPDGQHALTGTGGESPCERTTESAGSDQCGNDCVDGTEKRDSES